MKTRFFFLLALFLSSLLTACSSEKTSGSVTIASKQFTENILLSEMYAQLIENHTDLEVVRKQSLGSTAACFGAMENDQIDIYVEYTGTIYNELLGYQYNPDIRADDLYDLIKSEMNDTKEITVFKSIGPNNTYALAMLRAKADTMGIKTMSDISSVAPRLVFASNSLFHARINDGYDSMTKRYDLRFKSVVKMNTELLFDAARDDQVDVIVVYATDSLLQKYDMIILEDDKQMFPDYNAVPIIRNDVLVRYPDLNGILDLLAGSIDNEGMQELNYMVDIEKKDPVEVAKAFLTEQGLLDN